MSREPPFRPPEKPAALTIAQAARRLSVSPATAYRWARAGALPGACRVGVGRRAWRVDVGRLDEALFGDAVQHPPALHPNERPEP